jgi:monoamine oxidase
MEHKHPSGLSTDWYQQVLKTGFPRSDLAKERIVAIVGAGMAGLVAGWLLSKAAFQVKIYEASSKVGGRVKTLRDGFSSELYAEAGAMRIPDTHVLTKYLCEDAFGLKLAKFAAHDQNAFVYLNGQRYRISQYKTGCHFGSPYTKNRTADKIFKDTVVGPLETRINSKDWRVQLQLDHVSLEEYLRAFTKAGTNPITGEQIPKAKITNSDIDLVALEFGASALRASLLEACRDYSTIEGSGDNFHQIVGGMDQLPYKLASLLSESLRFNARVTDITRKNQRYQIHYDHTLTHRHHGPRPADFVILAAPFSALTHVRLDDVLDQTQLRAIRALHYDNATKIVLEFSERFWENDDLNIHGGRSFTDLPIRWVHHPSDAQNPLAHEELFLPATHGEKTVCVGDL